MARREIFLRIPEEERREYELGGWRLERRLPLPRDRNQPEVLVRKEIPCAPSAPG